LPVDCGPNMGMVCIAGLHLLACASQHYTLLKHDLI
jgi:hypothetical protein